MQTKEEVFDEKISPLLTKVLEICAEHRIPFACISQLSAKMYARSVIMRSEWEPSALMLFIAKMVGPDTPDQVVEDLGVTEETKRMFRSEDS